MKKNLLLLFGSLLLSLAIGELICRAKGSYLSYNERIALGSYISPFEADSRGWAHHYHPYEKTELVRSEFTDRWVANKDGLKEKEADSLKQGFRLMVLGDSFTEGVGAVPDSSYPRILESLLQAKDTSMQVINAGMAGSDIFFELHLLRYLQPRYQPDAVLVTCNPSDVAEHFIRGGFERFVGRDEVRYRRAPWFEPLYRHSLLVRVVVHDIFHYNYDFIRQKDQPRQYEQTYREMRAAIDSLQSFCALHNLRFGMVFHPFLSDFFSAANYEVQPLIDYCREKQIPYVDALPYLKQKGINETNYATIYWPIDGHFKNSGYELLAQRVYDFTNQHGFLSNTNHSLK